MYCKLSTPLAVLLVPATSGDSVPDVRLSTNMNSSCHWSGYVMYGDRSIVSVVLSNVDSTGGADTIGVAVDGRGRGVQGEGAFS